MSPSRPFHKHGDVFRPSAADRTKPGVSKANPRVEEKQRGAPRQGLQELPAPLPGRVHVFDYPRGFASLTPG